MNIGKELAEWAALFLRAQGGGDAGPGESPASAVIVEYPGVSPAAGELLRAVDAGGIPAFVTNRLKQIALENGVPVTDTWTPNQIVEAIRSKVIGSRPTDTAAG